MCWNNLNNCHDHTTDICLYVPFCIVFVLLGSVQIVSGIFYFISIPVVKLIVNIAIGCWVILTGIGGGMVACICASSSKKHEFLLYCSVSVLILNTVNLIYLEFGQLKDLFSDHVQKQLGKEYDVLESQNGRLITTVTAIALVLVAFLESQINFYLLNKSQTARKKQRTAERKNRKLYVVNDQSADLEYVIPKKAETHKKTSTDGQHQSVHVHNKSWVFEGTAEDDDDDRNFDESSVSLCSSSPTHSNAQQQSHHSQSQPHSTHDGGSNSTKNKRRFSRISDANSERFAQQMTSFSRCATPSPVPRSGQQTPIAGGSASVYGDYLMDSAGNKPNRLTVDFIAAAVPKVKSTNNNCSSQGPTSLTTEPTDSPYASLLAELEQSLIEKKISSFSPDNTSLTASTDKYCSSSKSSSKDLEFSKELEAALQLIQELETPSEGPLEHMVAAAYQQRGGGAAHLARSESEKTLSAAVSLPSPEAGPLVGSTVSSPSPAAPTSLHYQHPQQQQQPHNNHQHNHNHHQHHQSSVTSPTSSSSTHITTKLTIDIQSPHNGKHILNVLCNETNSQSTSGYSSPNSSNLNSIREFDGDPIYMAAVSNVPSPTASAPSSSTTIPSYIRTLDMRNCPRQVVDTSSPIALTSSRSNSVNKSFLLFKKRSKLMPQSDFQSRIFKSECLAYLTEEELIQRHLSNRSVVRKIELNVARRVKGCQHYSNN